MNELMMAAEAAEYLRMDYTTLCRLAREGKVPAVKIGGKWRFKKEVLDSLFFREGQAAQVSVLVVDDDAGVRGLLAEIIQAEGLKVVAMGSGEAALAEIKRASFDLIFLDLVLPDVSGVDVLKAIKQLLPDTPVAVVTGYADEPVGAEALSLGPMILLRKPFAIQDVRHVLRLVISRRPSSATKKAAE